MTENTSVQVERYDQVIEKAADRFARNAPKHIRFENEKGYAIQLLQNNSYLMQVANENPGSLLQAITNIAAIGLSLNPAKKQAYLITRNVKIGDKWISKIFLEPSYVGLCDLATMSGSIEWIQANCAYENDEFIDNGPGERPTHKYNAFSKDRGAFAGVYCVAKTKGGDYLTDIMPAEDVNSIMARSEAYKAFKEKNKGNGGPWVSDFIEMAKKSVVRRAFKMWPKTAESERLENAIMLSNDNEGFAPIITSPALGQYSADQKGLFDQLISKSDALEMFVFTKTLDEAVFSNLYHSFEKGQKGKYQRIVDDLVQKGFAQMRDIAEQINELAENGEETAIAEAVQGFSNDALEHLVGLVTPQAASMIRNAGAQA
ncbi:MAG: recombinase RecT [Pseudomonadota bacterium]